MTGHFEAKKHAYRQTQDGVVISFVIHPNDVAPDLATAALGTRYMLGFAEIGDDDKPIELARAGVEYRPEPNRPAKPNADKAEPQKERKPFASLPLSQQAALRCQDNDFKLFMNASDAHHAASLVRTECNIVSRAELDNEQMEYPRLEWFKLEKRFQDWLTTQRYAEMAR